MGPATNTALLRRSIAAACLALGLASCVSPRATAGTIDVRVTADGETRALAVPAGSTVQQALELAEVTLGESDRVSPPVYTVLSRGAEVQVTRVEERFEVEQVVLPFERQIIRNEALPTGESRLLQAGSNGMQEVTYRIVVEQGTEVSRSPIKSVVTQESVPEIVMVGAQISFTPVEIQGTLAYLSGGNAWVMRADSRDRRPVVVSGDLDGRIFQLSPDGRWLLFSRLPEQETADEINSLWIVSTTDSEAEPIALRARNVVQFADWSPLAGPNYTVAYSTVEPSPGSPGWQANNDLTVVPVTAAGRVLKEEVLIPPNAGGQYGWWGTTYAWAPDGNRLAYARADSVGTVDLAEPALSPIMNVVAYQSFSDWAWVPGLTWGGDSQTLYLVQHGAPLGLESEASSPVFDILALAEAGGAEPILLAERCGMFAMPSLSPSVTQPGGELSARLAFLQALSPLESQTSSYQIVIMDRDGSNRTTLFPATGEAGLTPQPLVWSPDGERLAFAYRGDLWIVDAQTGQAQRLTGDAQTEAYDWSS
jgi:Tol biopolymer transport system component